MSGSPGNSGSRGPSLSPLAQRICQLLVQRARLPEPRIAYGDLARALNPMPAPEEHLKPNDQRLFDALDEVSRMCLSRRPPLPVLTSLVVRRNEDGSLGTPGAGHFKLVLPDVRDEPERQRRWKEELDRVKGFDYPECSSSTASSLPPRTPEIPKWLRNSGVIATIIVATATVLAAVLTPVVTHWLNDAPDEAPRNDAPAPPLPQPVAQPAPLPGPPQVPLVAAPAAPPPKAVFLQQTDKLDGILALLEKHKQRATFGAVAPLVGREPIALFEGYERTPRTAWVVSKATGLPTGTKKEDRPSDLLKNPRVIENADELRAWLKAHE